MNKKDDCECGNKKDSRAKMCFECRHNRNEYPKTVWNEYELGIPTCRHERCHIEFERLCRRITA